MMETMETVKPSDVEASNEDGGKKEDPAKAVDKVEKDQLGTDVLNFDESVPAIFVRKTKKEEKNKGKRPIGPNIN